MLRDTTVRLCYAVFLILMVAAPLFVACATHEGHQTAHLYEDSTACTTSMVSSLLQATGAGTRTYLDGRDREGKSPGIKGDRSRADKKAADEAASDGELVITIAGVDLQRRRFALFPCVHPVASLLPAGEVRFGTDVGMVFDPGSATYRHSVSVNVRARNRSPVEVSIRINEGEKISSAKLSLDLEQEQGRLLFLPENGKPRYVFLAACTTSNN